MVSNGKARTKGEGAGAGVIRTIGPERIATELVNEKTQTCRFFGGLVENLQTEVSGYEKRKSDRGVYKKLSTF